MSRRVLVSNQENIIDSRDVIERIKELESDLESAHQSAQRDEDELDEDDRTEPVSPDFETWLAKVADDSTSEHQDEAVELQILRSVAEEGESASSDWPHGETMIRDSYFEDWTRQFAEAIGALEKADSWPCTCIDWERAASELQHDYTTISFDGVDYWVRSC